MNFFVGKLIDKIQLKILLYLNAITFALGTVLCIINLFYEEIYITFILSLTWGVADAFGKSTMVSSIAKEFNGSNEHTSFARIVSHIFMIIGIFLISIFNTR